MDDQFPKKTFGSGLKVRKKSDGREEESEGAERGLISSIMVSGGSVLDLCVEKGVKSWWFNRPAYREIYVVMMEMREKVIPIDLITVTQRMEDMGLLESIGGAGEITDIFTYVVTGSNAWYYIEIMRDKSAIRTGIREASEVIDGLRESITLQEAWEVINGSFKKSREICEVREEFVSRKKESILDFYDEVERAVNGEKLDVIPTPFPSINEKVGGFGKGELVLVSGPKSSGKSLVGMQCICKAVFEEGKSGAVFSLEMPATQYIRRMTSYLGDISLAGLRRGRLTKREFENLGPTVAKIDRNPIEFYDFKNCRMTVDAIEREIRRMVKNTRLTFVVIDYLQLIKMESKADRRRDQEISEVTTRAKHLANEFGLTIIVLSAENYDGKIRESGGVEYDADSRLQIKLHKSTEKPEYIWVDKMRDGEAKYSVSVSLNGDLCRLEECDD